MYNKIFIKNNTSYILLLNLLLLSFFILSSFRPIPDSTHYLASTVDFQSFKNLDKINEIILFIKTPIYNFISPVFGSPYLYTCVSLVVNFLFLNLIFYVFKEYLESYVLAFFLTCLIILFKFLILISYFLNIEILQSLNYLIMNIDLFGYFTVRQIFGFIYVLTLFFLLKKNYLMVSLLIILNNFTHPNSNIFLIGIFSIYFLYLYIIDNKNLKILIFFLISNLIYLLYIFLKIKNFDTNLNYDQSLYYLNLIRDEADDFSFLWTLAYRLEYILLIISLSFINLFIYLKKNKFNFLVYLSICPILIFFFGSMVEYTNLYTKFYFIDSLIINLQPAWKIIGYSFFPQLIILGFNLKILIRNKEIFFKIGTVYFSALTIIIFIIIGVQKNFNELKEYYYYSFTTKSENNYEDWLKNHSTYNEYNFTPYLTRKYNYQNYEFIENNIFSLKKIFSKNLKQPVLEELVTFEDNYEFIKDIKKTIPQNNGLIVPPYLLNARGIFKDYAIYFVEHPDGNFAMGNFKFFKIIHDRMLKLFNTGYSKFPNKQTNLNYSFIRSKYLQLNEKEILTIKNEDNGYNYFITEKNHILDFPIILINKNYVVYKIK
jgi:hypothetical protein